VTSSSGARRSPTASSGSTGAAAARIRLPDRQLRNAHRQLLLRPGLDRHAGGVGNIGDDPLFVRNPSDGATAGASAGTTTTATFIFKPARPASTAATTAPCLPMWPISRQRRHLRTPPHRSRRQPPGCRQRGGYGAYESPFLPEPRLVRAVSRRTHGTLGDFDIDLPLDPSATPVEPRRNGPKKLILVFSERWWPSMAIWATSQK